VGKGEEEKGVPPEFRLGHLYTSAIYGDVQIAVISYDYTLPAFKKANKIKKGLG